MEVALLSSNKPSQTSDICQNNQGKSKSNCMFYTVYLFILYNLLSISQYPASLANADITPVFEKDDKTDKTNYRSISVLPNLS